MVSRIRPGHVLVLALVSIVALSGASCGRYFTATIQGYVKDQGLLSLGSVSGIVGATVKIYYSDPTGGGVDPFAVTTTAYNSTIPGWYSQKLIWQSDTPEFQDQGDVKSVWVVASQPDYKDSAAVQITGIVSDGQNQVPDITLVRQYFTASATGLVGRLSGGPPPTTFTGVDGVKIGLELNSADTVENDDYVTYSAGVLSGTTTVSGSFAFALVRWQNANATGAFDSKTVKLWFTPPSPGTPFSEVVTLNSGQTANVLGPFTY